MFDGTLGKVSTPNLYFIRLRKGSCVFQYGAIKRGTNAPVITCCCFRYLQIFRQFSERFLRSWLDSLSEKAIINQRWIPLRGSCLSVSYLSRNFPNQIAIRDLLTAASPYALYTYARFTLSLQGVPESLYTPLEFFSHSNFFSSQVHWSEVRHKTKLWSEEIYPQVLLEVSWNRMLINSNTDDILYISW